MVGILLMFLYLWYPLVQAAPGQSGTSPKKITVKGVVLDDAKEPLIGVSVLVKGIEGGTITNVDGKFTIEAPANGVLIFSYIGMDTQEVDIKGRQDIIVTMRSGVVALSDVVVIGYGEASRRTITSSISKVKGSVSENQKMKKIPVLKSLGMLFSNVFFWIILFYFCVPGTPGWAAKNWLPTLFSDSLSIDISVAGPMSTISIALSSLFGVLAGGYISDRWVLKNVRGRVYTGAMGLGLIIPSLLFIGYGHSIFALVMGAMLFGIGFGMFDANNMPILCQFVSARYRATAYGIMNMCGVFAGATITSLLGESMDAGHLGRDFALLAILVFVMLVILVTCLRPKTIDMKD